MFRVLVVSLFFNLLLPTAYAQPTHLPSSAAVAPYQLLLTSSRTTVLIFPAPLLPGDKGQPNTEFVVQKQPGLQNVLTLKAAKPHFTPSNLHVFTADGKYYVFEVAYADSLALTTYDLGRLSSIGADTTTVTTTPLLTTGQPFLDAGLPSLLHTVHAQPAHYYGTARGAGIVMTVETLQTSPTACWVRLKLVNRSGWGFSLDNVRWVERDQHTARRRSVQLREWAPVYQEAIATIAPGDSVTFAAAFPLSALAMLRKVDLVASEREAGRVLTVHLHHRRLLHLRPLPIVPHENR